MAALCGYEKEPGVKALCGVLFVHCVWAAAVAQPLTADEILGRVERTLEGIQDYTVQLQATVDMERLQVPSMSATMYFKAPDKIHFESTSFAMLPREGLALNPADLRRTFRGEYLGQDTLDGVLREVLRLHPLREDSRRRSMTLWVDPSRWVVTQLRSQPFEGRRLLASFFYVRVKEEFWLPETLVVSFETLTPTPETGISLPEAAPEARRQRAPLRQGTITVVYTDYRVNTGLPDDMFEEKKDRP